MGNWDDAAAPWPGGSRHGQVALVTGGSAFLGLAIGAAMARAGSAVVLASRSAGALPAGRTRGCPPRPGAPCRATAATSPMKRAVTGLVERVLADHGRLDVLVTSAGVQARGTLDQLDVAALRACLEVNVVGTWLACRAAAAPMRVAGYGRILTLASALGPRRHRGPPALTRRARAPSSSSPAASPWNSPEPGSPSTPWPRARFALPSTPVSTTDPQVLGFLSAEVPLGRSADPAELTGAALLLTDPQSRVRHRLRPARRRRLDRSLN